MTVMLKYRFEFVALLLAIFYLVGMVSMSTELRPDVIVLTPLNLLLTVVLLLVFNNWWTTSFYMFAGMCFAVGFGIELLGVHTGVVFGDYEYGTALGPRLFEVPLMIGVNWFLLAYCFADLVARTHRKTMVKAFIGALLMTLLDAVMEPVAMKLNFWNWEGDFVPFKNYVAWFFVSYFLIWLNLRTREGKPNNMAPLVLLLQLIFFGFLNFTA